MVSSLATGPAVDKLQEENELEKYCYTLSEACCLRVCNLNADELNWAVPGQNSTGMNGNPSKQRNALGALSKCFFSLFVQLCGRK